MAATRTKRPTSSRSRAKSKASDKAKAEDKGPSKRELARQEREERLERERQEAIDRGTLVVVGDTEFTAVENKDKVVLDKRAADVIATLQKSNKPVLKKDLQEKFGGPAALYIPIFSTLKALGHIEEFRAKTGSRGGSGVAYLWVTS